MNDKTYDKFMSPLENRELGKQRKRLIPRAKGKVLEIGSGTGVNVSLYNMKNIGSLTLSDYEISEMLKEKTKVMTEKEKVEVLRAEATKLPFEDKTFDTVVATFVYCSVEDPLKGLEEIKRVLKDNGQLIYIEHIAPTKKFLRWLTDVLTPGWKKMAGNCHLNRDYEKTLRVAGMRKIEQTSFYGDLFIGGVAEKVESYVKRTEQRREF